jgi:aryl-alcohol dehydrogenase-like predicted oxidoreductase
MGAIILMQKRIMAGTDLNISPIGLGTVKLGRTEGVKYPTAFTIPDDKEAADLLAFAKHLGINLIDTAPAYGNSEERLGKLLKGSRNDWIICTKTGEVFENGESTYNFTPKHTRKSVEDSLRKLNTDVLDIVLVHSDGNDIDIINRFGTLDVLSDLKREGKIRFTGMSTKTVEGGILALQHSDMAMVTYNMSNVEEKSVIQFAAQNNKGILIKKALGSGHLTSDFSVADNIKFILKEKGVSSIVIGSITKKHIEEIVVAAS